ncbi:MAG: hypothetical protein LBD86_03055, partial [Spirochaetaceae bacterium]|nr:hypothetical protein [Spirochaetaceae bacterium]
MPIAFFGPEGRTRTPLWGRYRVADFKPAGGLAGLLIGTGLWAIVGCMVGIIGAMNEEISILQNLIRGSEVE